MTVAFERVTGVAPSSNRGTAPAWMRRYAQDLVLFDIVAASTASIAAYLVRFGSSSESLQVWDRQLPYGLLSVVFIAAWLTLMVLSGAYERRVVGAGAEEYQRIVNGALRFVAIVAIGAFALDVAVARGFLVVLVPLMTIFTVVGRWLARRWLHRQRGRGACLQRTIVIGGHEAVVEVIRHLTRSPHAGYSVIGACADDPAGLALAAPTVPFLGRAQDILDVLDGPGARDVDVIAIAGDVPEGAPSVRDMAWSLERTNIELLVAPALTAVAGPRIGVRPVAGLPLLEVSQPHFSGPVVVAKAVFDRVLAAAILIGSLPVLAVLAVIIKLTSPGPVLFRQLRVGRNGERFVIWKLRTMDVDAESRRGELEAFNERDGLLFKMKEDPRVTRVGGWLRRSSLDELPQLVQVLTGKMSLVGPRPPLPSEVERYEDDVARRLLVKPGVTGMWQISGRSDLTWVEGIRLDLYYVENWSPAMDLSILWKTMLVIIRREGAY